MLASSSWLLANYPVSSGLSLFRTLIKRRRHHSCSYALSANLYLHRSADGREFWWHIRQPNILLQKRRRRSAGNIPNLTPAIIQHFMSVPCDAAFRHFQSDQSPLRSLGLRLLQFAEAIKPGFPHVDRIRNFMPVEGQATFQAQSIASTQAAGHKTEFFAC